MIKFGTDGWRARIADDFTYENVRQVADAFIVTLQEEGLTGKGVVVGYDNRFESEHFARISAEACSQAGLRTLLCDSAVPSPTLAYNVKKLDLNAGIMITASHNPPEWNGFKIKEAFGGSARPEFTKKVEKNLGKKPSASKPVKIETLEPRIEYLKYIQNFVDMDLIKRSGIHIALNPMFGSALGYLSSILKMEEVNGYREPLFGGLNPEPIPVNLVDFISYMQEMGLKYPDGLSVGIVLDGDGDRIGGVDPSGAFISSHNVFSLLLYHLVKNRKMSGKVVKTFNITRLVEKQTKKYGLPLTEVPIGFKHIVDIMLKEKVLIGGEESGGMGIQGNIPERDGNLCALLLLELMAMEKKTLKQILDGIMDELGHYYYDRIDLHTEKKSVGNAPNKFAGQKVMKVEDLDGTKLNFEDGSWILFRPSGTEPLLRIYAEAKDPETVKKLLAEGENLVNRS